MGGLGGWCGVLCVVVVWVCVCGVGRWGCCGGWVVWGGVVWGWCWCGFLGGVGGGGVCVLCGGVGGCGCCVWWGVFLGVSPGVGFFLTPGAAWIVM
ncbi:hypothetical protein, partial [Pseudomonas syringae group genomosp. 7]|uniref:hypothetical protein n=1 Tax=Pseudomonas syringae group genomosp. 7 TaxID=251699 RepID=UPI00376F5F1F